jgi:hypothetical protein
MNGYKLKKNAVSVNQICIRAIMQFMKNIASEFVALSFEMLVLNSEYRLASTLGPEQTCVARPVANN